MVTFINVWFSVDVIFNLDLYEVAKMTEKRFKHMLNRLGMQFICYDDVEVLLGTFADKDGVNHIVNKLNELSDENEQLKSTIKEVTELLSDEVDLFSDKATEHDIIAYVELKELDNKDAYYMATATKKAIKILKRCLNV